VKEKSVTSQTHFTTFFFLSQEQCLNSHQEGKKEGEEQRHDKHVKRNLEM